MKSTQFDSLRTVGHPVSTARIYNARNVDELIVLDIFSSINSSGINVGMVSMIANECFMPITVGGGINSIADIYSALNAGADKVSINTRALEDVSIINEASQLFGSQCIVASIDVIVDANRTVVYNRKLGTMALNPIELAIKYQNSGAGEILLTCVNHDGMNVGYSLDLIRKISDHLDIPIIVNGGMGYPDHAVEAINAGADAVAASHIFHYTQFTPRDIKLKLDENNIPVRL